MPSEPLRFGLTALLGVVLAAAAALALARAISLELTAVVLLAPPAVGYVLAPTLLLAGAPLTLRGLSLGAIVGLPLLLGSFALLPHGLFPGPALGGVATTLFFWIPQVALVLGFRILFTDPDP